ncbi:MAG: glycerate kinase [Phycisphaerae bacterium]|jgi:glycerate kinase
MRIIIAPDSFKESLGAREVAEAIARGVRRVRPDAVIEAIPLADGGEGTVDALVCATGGELRRTEVTGPLGERVVAPWGLLGDEGRTAVIEMAAASGLALVPLEKRNPLHTTTFGTGELIRTAIEAGASRILVGIGGSATTDGGAGAAQAVGVRFFDRDGALLPAPLSGGQLEAIARIEMPGDAAFPRPGSGGARPTILVACDVDNPLHGPRGAAAVFGPQKGATPEQVAVLDRNLAHLADLIGRDLGRDVRDVPGAGAAGGLGAGLIAFFNARLERGINLVMEAVHFAERIRGADLILTGEGRLDAQSMMGKVIAGVGRAGKDAGVPVVALVGCVGEGAEQTLELLHGFHPIHPPGLSREAAFARTPLSLEETAAAILRNWPA